MRDGSNSIDWKWLLHELRHNELCSEVGGCDSYGELWFHDLEIALLAASLVTDPEDYFGELHDRMPMEIDAEQRAVEVESKI